jgi:hypothetical protein
MPEVAGVVGEKLANHGFEGVFLGEGAALELEISATIDTFAKEFHRILSAKLDIKP